MRRNERHRSSSFRTSSSGTNKMEYEISESMEKQLSASAESVKVIPVPSCNPTTATTYTSLAPIDLISGHSNSTPVLVSEASVCPTSTNYGGNVSSNLLGSGIRKERSRRDSKSASPPLQRSAYQQQRGGLYNVKTEPADPNIPWIPGTSAPISVDRVHSVKITRKLLQNWRTACGRTKDSFIRRWKTLPENQQEFEPPNSPSTSKKKGFSTSNLNNNPASSSSPFPRKVCEGESSVKPDGESFNRGTTGRNTVCGTTSKTPVTTLCPTEQNSSSNKQPSAVGGCVAINNQKGTVSEAGGALSTCQFQSDLRSCDKDNLGGGPTRQPLAAKTENEMPVAGIIGRGLSGGGNDRIDPRTNIQANNSNATGGIKSGSGMSGGGTGRASGTMNNPSGTNYGKPSTTQGGSHPPPGVAGQQNKSTGWSVHVWATYVQRDDLERDGLEMEEPKPNRDYLSDFQKVKLTHFFRHVLDMNHDDVISAEDFVALNQRIRHYVEWSSECIEFHVLKEVHSGFLECFLNQPLDENSVMYYCSSEKETKQHVNIDEWLDVWGEVLRSAGKMESLPLWLQYFPKILFQVINKSGSGTISREELRAFYTMFLGIDFRVVNDTLDSIHKAMTDGCRHPITYDVFKMCFANFLLGRYPHGPGQFLFGICSPQTIECSFPIDYSALNTDPSDLEPYNPDTDKSQSNRRSVIV